MTETLLELYVAGRLAPPVARIVEERVVIDPQARAEAGDIVPVDSPRLVANLDAILAATVAPRRPWFERAARRVGVPERIARVIGSTPALRLAWCAAVLIVLVLASAAGEASDRSPQRLAPFLALAPVVSVLGVAMSYGSFADRSHEVAATTPLAGLRLLLIRTCAVLVAAMSVCGLAALTAPSKGLIQLAWLLPTFALTAATLAASARLRIQHAAMAVSLVWLIIVVAIGESTDDSVATFGVAGQISCAAVAGAGAIFLALGRRALDHRGVS